MDTNGLKNADALYGDGFEEIKPIQREVKDGGGRPLITVTVNARIRRGVNWKAVSMKQVVSACSTALRSSLESITNICKNQS